MKCAFALFRFLHVRSTSSAPATPHSRLRSFEIAMVTFAFQWRASWRVLCFFAAVQFFGRQQCVVRASGRYSEGNLLLFFGVGIGRLIFTLQLATSRLVVVVAPFRLCAIWRNSASSLRASSSLADMLCGLQLGVPLPAPPYVWPLLPKHGLSSWHPLFRTRLE